MTLVARSGAELSHLSRSVEALRLNWRDEIARSAGLEHLTHLLHPHSGHTLHILRRKLSLTVLLALSQRHVQGFRHQDTTVHFSNGFRCLFRRRKAHKSKTFREREIGIRKCITGQITSIAVEV